ncbi:MAG: trypsin-like serine protease [Chloroflexi bacterium]|nr:trypsin-like serine protease [Chloroflexota bacterium]
MKKVVIAWILTLVLVFSVVGVASAVTDGELDGDGHPMVVLLVMDVEGEPMYRCSGTLLSPTVVLTAGHCASNYPDPEYTGIRVFTESDVQYGNNNYPYCNKGDKNCVEAVEWHAHPEYPNAPFFYHDVGVVVLKKPVKNVKEFGVLPEVNQLDILASQVNKPDITFTSVGYGVQESFPDAAAWKENNVKIRMVAYPKLIQINTPGFTGDFSLLLSNNTATGGTCYGDSGGPNFLYDGLVVAGVTSFGLNPTCGGTGGVFRMDRQDVLDFVEPFLEK